jgi:hypothetical protein
LRIYLKREGAMKEKKTTLSLKDIERLYFEEKLRRLQGEFSLKLKRTKPRDPEKKTSSH